MMTFLGLKFHTDHKELTEYLSQDFTSKDSYKHDLGTLDEKFPGILTAATRAIKDLNSKRIPCESLVYINGVMQAWSREGFDAITGLPTVSKLCPNKSIYKTEL